MGAEFQFERVEATERKAVEDAFRALQDQDAYERGNSYSGGFNMARGLTIRDDMSFEDRDDAYDWLTENAEKWEHALAVRHVNQMGQHVGYFVGAMCAS